MIIDFHTHSFPDKIAEKTISYLAEKGKIQPFREGTLSSLKKSMKESGIDISVVLPVATSPRQVESINRLAKEENGREGIIYAGAVHPDCENIGAVLDDIKSAGLFGVKIHPDYQGVYFDDPKVIAILEEAAKRDLYVVTHAGLDVGYPDDIHCTPDMVLRILEKLGGIIDNKLVLAHLGGCDMYDEVLDKLAGKPVYMDTAVVLDRYYEKSKEIILKHGADKILFATDSPWAPQKKFADLIRSYGFDEETERKIFSENAKKIIKLDLSAQ